MSISVFDVINSINNKTKLDWEEAERDYVPWVINNGMSNNIQTLFFANEMNKFSFLPKKQQYDFYMNGVPKGKRFDSWVKKEGTSDDIQAIKQYYCINNRRAEEYLKILTVEQVKTIKNCLEKGGRK